MSSCSLHFLLLESPGQVLDEERREGWRDEGMDGKKKEDERKGAERVGERMVNDIQDLDQLYIPELLPSISYTKRMFNSC